LTNYRSETAEIVARIGLAQAHGVEFPSNPQEGKTNANQPVLGFDGWGLLKLTDGSTAFVLVQVKGTESADRPPREASILVDECLRVPKGINELCRALSILVLRLEGEEQQAVLKMLEQLGRGELPSLVVAPVVVRGVLESDFADLQPVRDACDNFSPAVVRGLAVSIGAELDQFGREVMARARAA
jgi:hypothetical protein